MCEASAMTAIDTLNSSTETHTKKREHLPSWRIMQKVKNNAIFLFFKREEEHRLSFTWNWLPREIAPIISVVTTLVLNTNLNLIWKCKWFRDQFKVILGIKTLTSVLYYPSEHQTDWSISRSVTGVLQSPLRTDTRLGISKSLAGLKVISLYAQSQNSSAENIFDGKKTAVSNLGMFAHSYYLTGAFRDRKSICLLQDCNKNNCVSQLINI